MDAIGGLLQAVVTVVALVVDVLLLAWATRRLLGIRLSLVRTVLGGLVALAILNLVFAGMVGTVAASDPASVIWFVVLGIASALLGAMVVLVLAEVFLPTGSVPGPLEWRRGLRGWLRRTARYSQISRVLVRHGLGGYLSGRWRVDLGTPGTRRRVARSVRRALDECGVTFIKLGQVLATRSDVLPPEFVDELRALQDQAARIPWTDVERVLQAELGGPIEDVFAHVEPVPLAAASIAQVHAARLHGGGDVVIKVRRPGVEVVVGRDLDILARLARRLQRSTGWGRAIRAVDLADGFAAALRDELDFRIEARNMTAVAAAAPRAGAAVRVPVPREALCTERMLVMERLDGIPVGLAGPAIAERGLDGGELARALLDTLLRQIMLDGVFHTDPHAGNILLLADGRLGLLDFGSVGRLDPSLRRGLQRLLVAINGGDAMTVCDALLDVVDAPEELDEERLERALGAFVARHLGPGRPPDVRMFTDLFRIVAAFELAIPPAVAAVFRTMATAEGVLTGLAPGFDVVAEARAFGRRHLADELRPESLERTAMEQLALLLPSLRRLPRRLDRISSNLEKGRLSVGVRLLADRRERQTVAGLLHQVLLTVLSATAGIMGVLLLGLHGGPSVGASVTLYQLFGYCLLIICSVLALRVLVVIFRLSRD